MGASILILSEKIFAILIMLFSILTGQKSEKLILSLIKNDGKEIMFAGQHDFIGYKS